MEGSYTGGSSLATGSLMTNSSHHRQLGGVGLGAGAIAGGGATSAPMSSQRPGSIASMGAGGGGRRGGGYGIADQEHQVDFHSQQHQQQQLLDLQQNDEIVISAAMQQLRDPGVLIVAHGSRGKPKTVRLQLTESSITWRTETRKKSKTGDSTSGSTTSSLKPKMGKLHQVPLSHIMYVDVGKQTTALRRVENASVSEALCFSLLTKEGSLDLEANSPRERDALVSCFSLVLDEVHAQNWRDIYRGPSSDMPSSFDELDPPVSNNNNNNMGGGGGNMNYGEAHRK